MKYLITVLLIATYTCAVLATYCGRPPSIENGYCSDGSSKWFRNGHVIRYKCNSGFKLKGSETTTCLYSHSRSHYWSNPAPSCIRISPTDDDRDDSSSDNNQVTYCNRPRPPVNGKVRISSTRVGSIVKYFCNSGYQLSGKTFRKCQSNGQWHGSAPVCMRESTECPPVDAPENGFFEYTGSGRNVGAKVWYRCKSGFTLVGSESRKCRSDLEWSPEAPICEPAQCPDLNAPKNGRVKFTDLGRRVGSKAWFKCDNGFRLDGSKWSRCQSNLRWSHRPPQCVSVCERLINPKNGHVVHNGTSLCSWAKYSCKEGFYLVGDRFRKCVETGWTGTPPVCKVVRCNKLRLDNGRVYYTRSRSIGSVAKHTCYYGYELSGDKKRVCDSTGNWTGTALTCKKRTRGECPELPNPENGVVKIYGLSVGSSAKCSCFPGYSLEGSYRRHCNSDGTWSGHEPRCVRMPMAAKS